MMPSDQQTKQEIEERLKRLLPPPIGDNELIMTIGTKEVLAMGFLLQALESRGGT